MAFLLGAQKYFIAALVALVLLLGGTSLIYRANYHTAQIEQAVAEANLRETTASLARMEQAHAAQIEALFRADAEIQRLSELRRTARERIINAPASQDGPVSHLLRDTINGVR